MDTPREAWIKRITALLNHAQHPNANPEEAAAAAAMATALARKFQVEDWELEKEGKRQKAQYTTRTVRHVRSTFERQLLAALAGVNFCKVTTYRLHKIVWCELFGTLENTEITDYLFCWFRDEIDRMARADYRTLIRQPQNADRKWYSYHTGYRMGALNAVWEKLAAQHRQDQDDTNVQALIVVRDADLNDAYSLANPGIKTAKLRRVMVEGDAYSAGYDAGTKLSLPNPKQPKLN